MLSVVADSGQTEYLASLDGQIDIRKSRAAQVLDAECFACDLVELGWKFTIERDANDQFHDLVFVQREGIERSLTTTVAQDGETIRDLLYFTDPMRDIDHARPARSHLPDIRETGQRLRRADARSARRARAPLAHSQVP